MTDAAPAPDRPNIVFFMVDQLSAKWIEGDSAAACPTPKLDRLRADGVTFTRAITSNPLCLPARSTLATGLTTRGHGVLANGYRLDPALWTFMRALQGAGWRTGAFGKVHLQPHYMGAHADYRPYGFDVVCNTEDTRAGEWLDWVRDNHPAHYDAALAVVPDLHIPELRAYGLDRIDLVERIRPRREAFRWTPTGRPYPYYDLPFPSEVSQTGWITACALDFLRAADPARPLYAHVSTVQPHSPFTPPREFLEQIDGARIPAPVPPEWAEDPRRPTCFETSEDARKTIPHNWREYRTYYLASVAHLDHQLGRVIEAVTAAGRWENTYLLFLADHGELLMDHGFSGKGERHYDASIRVPLIVAGPGVAAGRTVDAFVQLEDVCPTVLEMAGLPAPAAPTIGPYLREEPRTLAGRSLMPWLRGETPGGWRDAAYVESYNNIGSAKPLHWARTVRTSRWRYTLYPGGHGEQLFDLDADPDETQNLAFDPAFAGVRTEMRDRLLEAVVLQDYPHTPRGLFAHGAH